MSNAIADKALQHASATSIGLYSSCPRRWFAQYVLGLREERSDAKDGGTNIHDDLDKYWEGGPLPKHPAAQLALQDPTLPRRGEADVLVEHPRDFQLKIEAAGVKLKGRADLLWVKSDQEVVIIDWKTSSSLNYIKTPDELLTNTQLNIYAKYVTSTYPAVDAVWPVHVNICRDVGTPEKPKKPKVKVVWTPEPMDRAHIDKHFGLVEAVVEQMKDAAAYDDPEALLANPGEGTCKAFRKLCPFASQCSAFKAWNAQFIADEGPVTETIDLQALLAEKSAAMSATEAPEAGETSSTVDLETRVEQLERRLDELADKVYGLEDQ